MEKNEIQKSVYKGYWMVTNRCNLRCSYCVLEDAPHQIKSELTLADKLALVSHLYEKLNFRRLTLSGGEVLIIGKHPPRDFISLLQHLRQYRSRHEQDNLEVEMYTNGTFLTDEVVEKMHGVVDTVAITIDSIDNTFLTNIGRNFGRYKNYYENFIAGCSLLSQAGIEVKLHSVISSKNYASLPQHVSTIIKDLNDKNCQMSAWKFYQYMSYDMPEKDQEHMISRDIYRQFREQTTSLLGEHTSLLHFKDNQEMNASLFNILSYGNAQYMRDGDTWSSSQRTQDLRNYQSMQDLFSKHDINEVRFREFHEIKR